VLVDQHVSPILNSNLAQMLVGIAEGRYCGILHTAGAGRVSRYEFPQKLAEDFGLNHELIAPTIMGELRWKARRPKDSSLKVSKCSSILTKPVRLKEALKAMKHESLQ